MKPISQPNDLYVQKEDTCYRDSCTLVQPCLGNDFLALLQNIHIDCARGMQYSSLSIMERSNWHFKLFHEEDARSSNPQVNVWVFKNPAIWLVFTLHSCDVHSCGRGQRFHYELQDGL
jgi:hypothetical protein